MNYVNLTKKFKPEAFSVGVELNTMERFHLCKLLCELIRRDGASRDVVVCAYL